jgi:Bacterial regulatory proteins, luxR family
MSLRSPRPVECRRVAKIVAKGPSTVPVGEGLTKPQIASRLLMGRATVKTHLEHIFANLAVTSRSELASQAARRGS